MKAYRELMEIYEVSAFRACATSAMRDAENGAELVEKIYEKTDIRIEIIDGREEARLISADLIRSLATQTEGYLPLRRRRWGSTELNLVRGAELIESRSFDIGTIRQLSGRCVTKSATPSVTTCVPCALPMVPYALSVPGGISISSFASAPLRSAPT